MTSRVIFRATRVFAEVVGDDPWCGRQVEVLGRTRAGGVLVRSHLHDEERHLPSAAYVRECWRATDAQIGAMLSEIKMLDPGSEA